MARKPPDQMPEPARTQDSRRPTMDEGRAKDGETLTGKTTTDNSRRNANPTDRQVPTDCSGPPATNATSPARGPPHSDSQETNARDRAASRPRNDGHQPDWTEHCPVQTPHSHTPPAHQVTAEPDDAHCWTTGRADPDQKPKPRSGPPTAKTRGAEPRDRAADRARASAPTAQPDAMPKPRVTEARTTDETKPAAAEPESDREPQKPTTEGEDERDTAKPRNGMNDERQPARRPPPGVFSE